MPVSAMRRARSAVIVATLLAGATNARSASELEARERYRRALELDPDHELARSRLAQLSG